MVKHNFGGNWTSEKLSILSDYLSSYIIALSNQPFQKIYIDAFAGNGRITVGNTEEEIDGSVRLALNSAKKFDSYIFIEKKKTFASELGTIISEEFPLLQERTAVRNQDCNIALKEICISTNWKKSRAILFLDPYATEVEWETLKIVAETKAIDVWYLFPFSAAVRMMKKDGDIDEKWKLKLNKIFGDDAWFERFYIPDPQISLFGDQNMIKDVNTEKLAEYICERLSTVFPNVAGNPRLLYNTKNSPLFLFCFAISNDNPRAASLALRIADHILKNSGRES